ncbi:hypothetical protein TNCV_2119781 [Trichonephila clavipes]|nr:hypothetical protein TNCV_2119781 [Trichonephila clavipes]
MGSFGSEVHALDNRDERNPYSDHSLRDFILVFCCLQLAEGGATAFLEKKSSFLFNFLSDTERSSLQKALKGLPHDNVVQAAVENCFQQHQSSFTQKIHHVVDCWDACLNLQGDFV